MNSQHWLELKVPPVLVVLIMALAMYGASGAFPEWGSNAYLASTSVLLVMGQNALSFTLMVVAVLIGLAGVLEFRRVKTTVDPTDPSKASQVVDSGIFARTRNPMYLGMFILLLAWAVALGNLLSFAALPLFIGYMNRFQIMPEERILTRLFGEDYQRYLAKVNRWV